MGLFSRFSSLFTGAPKAEVDKINDTLRNVAIASLLGSKPDTVIVDDAEPYQYRPGRVERRKLQRELKLRDRNTKFSNRHHGLTPRRIHNDAHNKSLNFINHGILHSLFQRAGVFKVEGALA